MRACLLGLCLVNVAACSGSNAPSDDSRTVVAATTLGPPACQSWEVNLPTASQIAAYHNFGAMCLDDWAWSQNPGNGILEWNCEDIWQGHYNQIWRPYPTDSGFAQIRNAWSAQCLEVQSASTSDGAQVVQNPCDLNPEQQFLFETVTVPDFVAPDVPDAAGFGAYPMRIHPRHAPTKCLRVQGGSTAAQAPIVQDECTDPSVDPSTVFIFKQGSSCRPLDPCAPGYDNGGCAQSAACSNADHPIPGGNICVCPIPDAVVPPPGDNAPPSVWLYQTASVCRPTCASTNGGGCSPDATCSDTASGPFCTCNSPYTGNGKDCVWNQCTNCPLNSSCVRSGDIETCHCDPGYYGSQCIDPCDGDPCGSCQCTPHPDGTHTCVVPPPPPVCKTKPWLPFCGQQCAPASN